MSPAPHVPFFLSRRHVALAYCVFRLYVVLLPWDFCRGRDGWRPRSQTPTAAPSLTAQGARHAQSSGNAAEIQKWQERQRQVTAARAQLARKPAAAGKSARRSLEMQAQFHAKLVGDVPRLIGATFEQDCENALPALHGTIHHYQ